MSEIRVCTGLRRIHIENVQSIVDLTLDFDETGVYRLVGDNDVGKSAILRAITALFTNVSRSNYKEYISDWADTFIVEGWFYDGGYVKLSRGAEDFYEWSIPNSGEKILKTDGKVPLELQKYFNLYSENDKSKLTLNFNLQGDVLPFVDTTASDNFWLTQKALGTNLLLKASKRMKLNNSDIDKEIKITNENIDYENEIAKKIDNEIRTDEEFIDKLSRNISVINEEQSELEKIKEFKGLLDTVNSMKTRLQEIPVVSDLEFHQLSTKSNELSLLKEYKNQLDSISLLKRNLEINELKSNQLRDLEILQEKDSEIVLLNNYKKEKEHITTLKIKYSTIMNSINVLDLSTFSNKISEMNDLLKFKKEKEYINNLVKSKENTELLVVNIEKEILELKTEEKICPVCGSDLLEVHTHSE